MSKVPVVASKKAKQFYFQKQNNFFPFVSTTTTTSRLFKGLKFSVFKILRRRMELETAKEKKFEIENPV